MFGSVCFAISRKSTARANFPAGKPNWLNWPRGKDDVLG